MHLENEKNNHIIQSCHASLKFSRYLISLKNELKYETLLTVEDPIFSGQLESTT